MAGCFIVERRDKHTLFIKIEEDPFTVQRIETVVLEFIRDVEFIPLESTKDSWFRYSENYLVGEKYVMVGDVERARVILFDRQGKFIRTIGTKGKGPHELIEPRNAAMHPAEEFVFFYDAGQGKLIRFSIEGELNHMPYLRQIREE